MRPPSPTGPAICSALGGTIVVIHKPDVGHHPHGLEDPTPVVQFVLDHLPPVSP